MRFLPNNMQFTLAIVHIFWHIIDVQRGQDGPAPHTQKEKKMKLQIIALILQLITLVALVANIVHHW